MTISFFIFSSASDRPMARRLGENLRSRGSQAWVVLDAHEGIEEAEQGEIISHFPRNGRLRGDECSLGILDTMAEHGSEVVAKIDADNAISDEGMEWLRGVHGPARGFRINGHDWCGVWSIRHADIAAVRGRIARARCLFCPEAGIIARATHQTIGRTVFREPAAAWRPGFRWPAGAPLVMLPSSVRGSERTDSGMSMMDQMENGPCLNANLLQ